MKAICNTQELSKAISACMLAIQTRTTLPILGCLLVKAEGNKLLVTSTNLDQTMQVCIAAEVQEAGSVTVPARQINDLVKNSTATEVELDGTNNKFTKMKVGQGEFKLNGLDTEEFPATTEVKEEGIAFKSGTLLEALQRTSPAISTDETRYILNNCFMDIGTNETKIVATDGRRLAIQKIEMTTPKATKAVVPTAAINAVMRLLSLSSEVKLRVDEQKVQFDGEQWRLITKQTEGTYPNYEAVIPSNHTKEVTVNRKELLGAVVRAEMVTSEKSNSIRIEVTDGEKIQISAQSPEIGNALEVVNAKSDGGKMAIAINPKYMAEPLKTLEDEEICILLTDELSPLVLKLPNYMYVCMPMRMS